MREVLSSLEVAVAPMTTSSESAAAPQAPGALMPYGDMTRVRRLLLGFKPRSVVAWGVHFNYYFLLLVTAVGSVASVLILLPRGSRRTLTRRHTHANHGNARAGGLLRCRRVWGASLGSLALQKALEPQHRERAKNPKEHREAGVRRELERRRSMRRRWAPAEGASA